MLLQQVSLWFEWLGTAMWGYPLIFFVLAAGAIMTITFGFVQVRFFAESWKYIFTPEPEDDGDSKQSISSLEAFMSALSTSMGNGSLAGMATALFAGGPGAALWLLVLGFFTMVIRFAEIYASTAFTVKTERGTRGGPMAYLSMVPGGSWLPFTYAFFCLLLSVVTGNAMQCNSMTLGIVNMTGMSMYIPAIALFLFLIYVVLGGAQRIIKFSDTIAPIKVVLFTVSTVAVLVYFWSEFIPALRLIFAGAFSSKALAGGFVGHTMQNAIRFGISRTLSATEAGLGNAGVLFGATGSKSPVKSGIMSMASTFIATHIICFMMMLAFIMSGVWNSGLTSTPLVIAAYSTVFGALGGWVATILSFMFGVGVLVAYAFIGLECWLFVTGGRWSYGYYVLYCFMALFGSVSEVGLIWSMIDVITAGLTIINLYGLLCLLPKMRRGWNEYLVAKK